MLSFSPLAAACELYQEGVSAHSLMFEGSSPTCTTIFDLEIDDTVTNEAFVDLTLAEKTAHSSYWSDWLLGNETNPLISNSASSNYFGVGVWVPNELEDQLKEMNTENWIRSHGVQLSLGFGDMDAGTPRMRLDYRWHEQYDGDFMMQVEVPF
ncbi:hypothetical protein L1D14_21845 [Vibrio tubiashii]|uniref:hypothetical protein n=1 Tax=Vibrio tubiashii TaxID=29498 RepID=UPI001EFEBCC5|nr:hypothetical protein [Vibrio tubiashii]MCG9578857.1 hypothetical protein [Vibrio tubiashii]